MPEEAEDSLPQELDPAQPDQAKCESAADRLAAKEQRIEELTDALKRSQAEFENYKKRVEREWTERTKLAAERLVTELLATLDTLDKAEEADNSEGIRGIRRQLVQALQRAGLREVDTGVSFDPFMHEAMMREEREDEDDGTILEVFQKGYMMGPKVIRAAKVKVSTRHEPRRPDGEGADDDQDQEDDETPGKEESQ